MIEALSVYNLEEQTTLFSDDSIKYVIPLYQRTYAWTEFEIEQLIDDISEHDGDNYYIGSLVVYRRDNEYEVIDGQQRLTTLLLLMIALEMDEVPVKNILSFACRKRADDTLSKFIDKKEILEDELEQSIVRGKQIILEKFARDKIDKNVFVTKLAHLRLYRIQVPYHTDLNRYFEIMNTRGEQLEQHDILKASLMSEIIDEHTKSVFANIWDACSDMTGYVQMHFSTEMRTNIFGGEWKNFPYVYIEKQKGKKRKDEQITIDQVLAPDFHVETIDGVNDRFERVRFESIIEFPYFLMHVLRVYIAINEMEFEEGYGIGDLLDDKKLTKEFDIVIKHGVVAGKAISENKESFALDFINYLLDCRFLFDKYIIKREYANESADGEWSMKQLEVSGEGTKKKPYYKDTQIVDYREWNQAEKTKWRHKNDVMLQAALRVSYTSPKVMHWITDLLIWLYDDENRSYLSYYEHEIEAIAITAVRNNYLNDGNWNMGVNTPHIVFNYLDYLLWKKNKTEYADFDFEFRNSVEHWYPQHPSENTFDNWPQKEVDYFGNLCIVQRNINSKFSNMAPAAKKTTFEKNISSGSLKLRKMAELTDGGEKTNLLWHQTYVKHGQEMLEILQNACKEE